MTVIPATLSIFGVIVFTVRHSATNRRHVEKKASIRP